MRTPLALLVSALFVVPAFADEAPKQLNQPPKGFIALFNGKDLTNWVAMPHFDPRKVWAMSEAERTDFFKKHLEETKKHWTAKDGDLINDGNGAYLTTEKEYGD